LHVQLTRHPAARVTQNIAKQRVRETKPYGSIKHHTRQGEAALEQSAKAAGQKKFGFMSNAASVSVAIMISRVLGLARDMVQAKYFGAGLYTDAFNIAFRIPNLLRDLFAEGALSSAFIPNFIRRLTQEGKEQAWILANRVISALLVIMAAFTLLFLLGARWFVYLLAAGYARIPEKFDLTVQMTQIMSPFLLCIALASVAMGMLNACGSFFIPAMASSVFNACCILCGIFLSPYMPRWGFHPIVSMALGALIGGAGQFFIMVPSAHKYGFRFRFDLNFADPGLRQIARLMLPAIVGLSATQINITVDSQIASRYGDGPVSWLNYGFRLMQLPIGVFGIAIATVTMTSVYRYVARNETGKLQHTLASSLRLAACLTFPATVGLVAFREEIVRLIFERGSFLPAHTIQTSNVVMLYALGLFSYSAVKILVPTFYAFEDTRTPVRMSMITVAAKIVFNFAMIRYLGFLGLPLATTFASCLNLGLLLRTLRKKAGLGPIIGNPAVYLRIGIASLVMGLLSLLVYHASWTICAGPGWPAQAFRLGLAILVAIAALFPLLKLFKVEEGKMVLHMAASFLGNPR
jgi:putative peptidoglycan lipid II flippase